MNHIGDKVLISKPKDGKVEVYSPEGELLTEAVIQKR